MPRNSVTAAEYESLRVWVPDVSVMAALVMLERAMCVIDDLVYGDEDFDGAEQLLNEWNPVPKQDLNVASSPEEFAHV